MKVNNEDKVKKPKKPKKEKKMADIALTVTLLDLNLVHAIDCLLRVKPNIERKVKDGVDPATIPDGTPESDDTYYEDAYPTTKLWAEELLKRHLYRILRSGHKQLQEDVETDIVRTDYVA